MMRGKTKQMVQRFFCTALWKCKSVRIRIPLFYGNNDSRRCFFYMDGNHKLL